MPDVPEVRDKLEWLASHGSDYDTIFIGSSRVRRQIAPAVFDARMATHGIVVQSYNLGIDAMTFPELAYVLDRMLENKPPKLRLVVADLNALRRKLGPGGSAESLRTVYWHDFRHTAQVCEAVWRDASIGSQPWSEALPLLGRHIWLMMRQYSNLGRASEFIQDGGKTGRSPGKVDKEARGYHPVRESIPENARPAYERQLALKRAALNSPVDSDPVLERSLQRFTAQVERSGAKAIFFVGATVSTRRLPQPRAEDGLRPVTLNFDDPSRYPDLYLPDHRYDPQHLNSSGAELFTVLLADQLAPHVAAEPMGR